jgi:hypothetical protein
MPASATADAASADRTKNADGLGPLAINRFPACTDATMSVVIGSEERCALGAAWPNEGSSGARCSTRTRVTAYLRGVS